TLSTSIPHWITGQHQTVAVRVISHPLIQQLCQQLVSEQNPFGLLVSTSCNPSGQPPAMTLSEAYAYFSEKIGYLQADTLGYTLPSQIRDARTGLIIR
ncbi:MAG: L-threonylcarbamoyladenylate synthase, partial [Psychrobacter celer]